MRYATERAVDAEVGDYQGADPSASRSDALSAIFRREPRLYLSYRNVLTNAR